MSSAATRRLILTGAAGVGKTTLAQALAPRLKLELIPEVGRQLCVDMGFGLIGEIPDQQAFKQEVLSLQIEAEERLGSFISDRSTIDCWVLWQRWNICSAMTYDTEKYYDQALKQSEKYTCVIYIPPMFAPPEDGFRWTDADYQRQIDRLVRMTIFEWRLTEKTYVVQSEGINARVDEVINRLADLKII